jgi:hypothetical protein
MSNSTPGDIPAASPPATNETCPPYFLGLYSIALCYGGAEEGGWWYTWEDHEVSVIIQRGTPGQQAAEEIRARASLAEAAEDLGLTLPAPGLRGYRSAAPQVNAAIQTEERPGEHQSTERPRYE